MSKWEETQTQEMENYIPWMIREEAPGIYALTAGPTNPKATGTCNG